MAGRHMEDEINQDDVRLEALPWAVALGERGEEGRKTVERAQGYLTFLQQCLSPECGEPQAPSESAPESPRSAQGLQLDARQDRP